MERVIGKTRLNSKIMLCTPPRLVREAVRKELVGIWIDAYIVVGDKTIRAGANVSGAYFAYKVKTVDDEKTGLRAPTSPNGNNYAENYEERTFLNLW